MVVWNHKQLGPDSLGILVFAVLLSLVPSLSSAQSLPDSPAYLNKLPSECFALNFRAAGILDKSRIDGFLENNTSSYSTLQKFDVVCMGEHIVIDSPIFTNGGNAYFFADSIEFKEKLDTRVYRPLSDRMMFLVPLYLAA